MEKRPRAGLSASRYNRHDFICRALAGTHPPEPGHPAARDTQRLWARIVPVRPEWVKAGYGHQTRQRPASRAVALAIPSERWPKRESAAEVSRGRSLKTIGSAAFATGPATEGGG